MSKESPTAIVNSWIYRYGADILQTRLELDTRGECTLEFRDNIVITVGAQENSRVFYLVSPVASIKESPALQAGQLQQGLFFAALQATTLQGTVCLAPDKKWLLLSYSRNIEDMNEESFNKTMLLFLDTCVDAKQFLNEEEYREEEY